MLGSTTFWVLEFGELEFSMVLEFHQKIFDKFEGYFFKELKFMELEYSKNGKSLHISEMVVN